MAHSFFFFWDFSLILVNMLLKGLYYKGLFFASALMISIDLLQFRHSFFCSVQFFVNAIQ